MKTAMFLGLLGAVALAAPAAAARGRYLKGQTTFMRKCAPCVAIGWKWAPSSGEDWARVSLKQRARTWSTAKVCTWMRRNARSRQGPLCHPSRMTFREKLETLYFLKRRAQGAITKPVLRKRTFRVYRGPKFRKRAQARRARAIRQRRQYEALRKARSRGRRGVKKGRFHKSRKRPGTRGQRSGR